MAFFYNIFSNKDSFCDLDLYFCTIDNQFEYSKLTN